MQNSWNISFINVDPFILAERQIGNIDSGIEFNLFKILSDQLDVEMEFSLCNQQSKDCFT